MRQLTLCMEKTVNHAIVVWNTRRAEILKITSWYAPGQICEYFLKLFDLFMLKKLHRLYINKSYEIFLIYEFHDLNH